MIINAKLETLGIKLNDLNAQEIKTRGISVNKKLKAEKEAINRGQAKTYVPKKRLNMCILCPFHKNKLQPKHTAPDNRFDDDSPRL